MKKLKLLFLLILTVTLSLIGTGQISAVFGKNKGMDNQNVGQLNPETHRSIVAEFVQNLLQVADRDGGIGKQVRQIASEQNDSKEKNARAIEKIEKRSKLKTLFVGTDYKNTGALRSEMVKTRNQIEQLKRLAEQAQTEADKSEIEVQVENLEQEQEVIENFIRLHESQFSLLGWAAKLFAR